VANDWARGLDNHCDCRPGYFKKYNGSSVVRCSKCPPGCIECYDEKICVVQGVAGPGLKGSSSGALSESDRQRVLGDVSSDGASGGTGGPQERL
jgi:hypothetical protein